jgi:threonyl-tRNA synthetase
MNIQMKLSAGQSASDVLALDSELRKKALAIKYNNQIWDLSHKMDHEAEVEVITENSPEAIEILRHSASHIMAAAVKEIFPEVMVGIGPSTESGFYYDFEKPEPFMPEDLEKIENKMKEIISANKPFLHLHLPKTEALKKFEDMGEHLKVELINEKADDTVSLYQSDTFLDFCRGPHIPATGYVPVFKLLSTAGAYWKGDENNQMLQRIYGTAFFRQEDLDKHLEFLEEVRKRDHRKLGPQLDIYHIYEEAGSGLIFWHPNGAILRTLIEDFWKRVHIERGYQPVISPHIAESKLWQTSGHWDYYRENMYVIPLEKADYVLKPMNCPFHILMFNSRRRSFRELPVRYSELGTVYRYERQGVLHGMLRVRGFTQDDAHIFCTPEQVEEEIFGVLQLADYFFSVFGFRDYKVDLSVRDPFNKSKYLGSDDMWDMAEQALVRALGKIGWDYTRQEGEAVFYGPKIDIKLIDAIGNTWQATTVQFDFNLPDRFDLNYIGSDSSKHRIIMVHRAILGSLERFVGTLIEHFSGAFPVWLAPVQAVVIPISEKNLDYAESINKTMLSHGIRCELDARSEKMNYKVREAQEKKIPFMLIVGAKEAESGTVSIRYRSLGDLGITTSQTASEIIKWLDADKIISFEDVWNGHAGSIEDWLKTKTITHN